MSDFYDDENNKRDEPDHFPAGDDPNGLNTQNGDSRDENQNFQPYNNYNSNYYNGDYPNNGHGNNYNPQSPYGFPPPQENKPQKGRSSGTKVLAALLCVAIVLSCIGIALSVRNNNPAIENTETTMPGIIMGADNGPSLEFSATPVTEPTTSLTGELQATEVYKKIKESSVGVLVYTQSQQSLYTEGSGIIMGEDTAGEYTYIITCAHVISDSNISVRIQLYDGTQCEASIVGYDNRTDIGVLRIKASGLKAAEFADSSSLEVGQTVYAIGNPGGTEFAGSFTAGIVSAIDRPVSSSNSAYTTECIQHNAAINPGNSGGALVNAYGQIVGINSMKIVDDEYEGMGFAVPSSVFQGVVEQLIAYGYVPNRPKLGISYAAASAYRVYSMVVQIKELPAGSIVISEIASDSPLVDTDAQVYDMIIAVNGQDLTNTDYLAKVIENSKVGDKLKLTLVRVSSDYKTTEFTVTVALVEDKGTVPNQAEEATTEAFPSDYFFPFD